MSGEALSTPSFAFGGGKPLRGGIETLAPTISKKRRALVAPAFLPGVLGYAVIC